ncbi:MAG TPA: 3'(2'),5'-bisphosphate nucleotidase CysQ [Ramlibacter sp.]
MIDRAQLQRLCDIALAAGREVMDVYGTDFAHVSKEDDSPLTQADLRSDKVICDELARAFPGVFILSEESSPQASGTHERFFLVDPLDGTKEFLKRNDEFTVNIALVEQGVPVAGVVFAPALGELYYGAQGLGAWKSTRGAAPVELKTQPPASGAPLRVIGSRSHGGEELTRWLERLPVAHTFVAAGSSLKFCRLAEDAADVYPRLGPTSQWDTAAAQAVLEAAGGAVLEAGGRDLRYGLDRPILNPHFIALASRAIPVPPIS